MTVYIDGAVSTKHPLYETWKGMVRRCEGPGAKGYHNYGGRGISVCERWRHGDPSQGQNGFQCFVFDVGPRLDGQTLDRIDGDGDYTPENVRWATASEQQRNTRKTLLQESLIHGILDLRATHGIQIKGIADFLRIPSSVVRDVLNGNAWRSVSAQYPELFARCQKMRLARRKRKPAPRP